MSRWLVAFIGIATCVVSLGLLAAPAGALSTSTTAVTDNAAGLVTGGTLVFTATVTGGSGTPTGTLTWTVTDPLGDPVTCPDSTMLDSGGSGNCTIASAVAGTYSATATYNGDSTYSPSPPSPPDTPTVGRANQAPLSVTSTTGTYGTPLTLTTSGGSGTGAVSYSVANGTASGCGTLGSELGSTSAGTCLVTATKAADSNYYAASSAQTTVTLDPANQATLTVTSTTGTYGTALTLTTTGGSGTGAVSYAWSTAPPRAAPSRRVSSPRRRRAPAWSPPPRRRTPTTTQPPRPKPPSPWPRSIRRP